MYEYKVLEADNLANEDNLNEQGEERWELITIIENNNTFYYYFKRLKAIN